MFVVAYSPPTLFHSTSISEIAIACETLDPVCDLLGPTFCSTTPLPAKINTQDLQDLILNIKPWVIGPAVELCHLQTLVLIMLQKLFS
jgi:hypothetical protein